MSVSSSQPFRMSAKSKRLIRDAADVLVDQFHEDLEALARGDGFKDTWMAIALPERYLHRYDLHFAKLFLDTMIVVRWKIRDKSWWRLNSVAEELAMWVVLQKAEFLAETSDDVFEPRDLVDDLFEDFDFHWLFEPHVDGIEDDAELTREHRIENLRFIDWFKPFTSKGCYRRLETS
jgi:hypothetical protein